MTHEGIPSPRAFMRARRPDQFSDSVEENEAVLDRTLLEYQLATLGDRRQDLAFEDFSRRLSERVLCPNLMPHSGRDAGGDSKVDTETYPVSPKISATWYVGIPSDADSARWAFAFSAQQTWKQKARDDVEKIVETDRGYAKVIIISSQAIRDKERAAAEDKVREDFGVEVRIFDRNWILDRVFEGKHENLAIEELGISPIRRSAVRRGPNDTARERRLAEIEERIRLALAASAHGHQIVFDCIEAAVLARELEKPRPEADGMFLRARRLAIEIGTKHQQVVAVYQHAWTTYWYFEDFATYADLCEQVERLTTGTQNVYELELLHTLWGLLRTAISQGKVVATDCRFANRTAELRGGLGRIASDDSRPSASLQARTLLAWMDLDPSRPAETEAAFEKLKAIGREAAGLVGYPLKRLARMVSEIGAGTTLPGYDGLLESMVEATSERDGDVAGGRLLLRRAVQQMESGNPHDAIRTVGKSLGRLYKHETRHEVIRALVLCGVAYEQVGLLWAARGSTVTAAGLAVQDLWSREKVTLEQARCFSRMKWIELRLARLPHVLAWQELDRGARAALAAQGYDSELLLESEADFDALLGVLFLRADPALLGGLTRLPDALSALELPAAQIALLYGLGHEDEITRLCGPGGPGAGTVPEVFRSWRDQPAGADIPPAPMLLNEPSLLFASSVLGCRISCRVANESPCIEVAESVLAVVEALLATAFGDGVVAREPRCLIDVDLGDPGGGRLLDFRFEETNGYPHVVVTCRAFDAHRMSVELQARIKQELSDFIPEVLARVFMLRDVEETLTKLFRDERANDRAVNFTSSFVVLGSVMGDAEKLSLAAWTVEGKTYELRRDRRWDFGLPPPPEAPERDDESDEDLRFDPGSARHGDIETVSPIRSSWWDEAEWCGVLFLVSVMTDIPILAPIFRNADAAERIFAAWRKEIGERDERNQIRMSIVKGVSAANPLWYRVIVAANPNATENRGRRFVLMMSRAITLTPETTENLEGFLRLYERLGVFLIAPAVVRDATAQPDVLFRVGMLKRDLAVRQAWEIGRHDPDMQAIFADDAPILPEPGDGPAEPVIELLEWKRAGRSARR